MFAHVQELAGFAHHVDIFVRNVFNNLPFYREYHFLMKLNHTIIS